MQMIADFVQILWHIRPVCYSPGVKGCTILPPPHNLGKGVSTNLEENLNYSCLSKQKDHFRNAFSLSFNWFKICILSLTTWHLKVASPPSYSESSVSLTCWLTSECCVAFIFTYHLRVASSPSLPDIWGFTWHLRVASSPSLTLRSSGSDSKYGFTKSKPILKSYFEFLYYVHNIYTIYIHVCTRT